MNKNKIYQAINQFLDSYVIEGVTPQQFLNYLNLDEANYKLIYHKIYRKLTIEGISFESKELTEYLVDSIRDRIALLNDLKQGKGELPETIINQHPANTVNENNLNIPEIVYHFTFPQYYIQILSSDKLKSHPKYNQISFTTDENLWAFKEDPNSIHDIGVRLAFNTKDLPNLKPFLYSGHPDDSYEHEQEWITTSGDITNIKQIIKEVVCLDYYQKYLKDNLSQQEYDKIIFI